MTSSSWKEPNTAEDSSGIFTSLPAPFVFGLLYLVLAAYFFSFSRYGFNIWDEGGYAYGTLRTLQGQKAMQDFNPSGYLPGRYLYGALLFKLFGTNLQSLRIGVILLTPGMIFMVYGIARKIMPAGFAFLAALFMLSAPSMYYNRFFTFFCVMNLFCLIRAIEHRTALRFLLLGGSILLSGFFKFEVGLFSLATSLLVLGWMALGGLFLSGGGKSISPSGQSTVPGAIVWTGVGLLLAALAGSTLYLGERNFLNLAIKMVLESHEVWGNPFPDILPFFTLLRELGPHKMFEHLLFYLPLWIYGIVLILLARDVFRRRFKPSEQELYLLAITAMGVCAFGLVIWRAGFDNLLRTLAPAYILFCYLLFIVWNRVAGLPTFQIEKQRPLQRVKRVARNVVTDALPFFFFYEMNVNHGFYAGTIGAMRQETARIKLDRMDVYTNPQEAEWIQLVVDRITLYTQPGEPILVLPLNPIFYFLTDRPNPTPYDWILPGMLEAEEEKQLVEQLKTNLPRLIVYVDIPIDGRENRRLSFYAPQLYRFIAEHYVFEEFIGFFQILLPVMEHR